MASLNDLIVSGKARFLNTISGNIDGTSSNVTGTVAIAHGGTGATTRLGAAHALTNQEVVTPGFVVGLTDNWGKFGYTSIANLKTTIGSAAAASGGTAKTLCTTGEKYTWNNKSNLTIGTTATTAMAGNTNVNNVTQTATTVTSDTKYELLFSNTADNTNRTEGTRKSSLLTFSPEPAGVQLTMNYDGSRPNNYGDITIKGNNDSDSYIALHSSSAGMSYLWIKHPTPSVGIFLEGGSRSNSSSDYSHGAISADDFVVWGHDLEGNNITWDGTNTSLKTAITNKLDKSGGAMTGNITYSLHEEISGGTSTCDRTTKVNERGLQYTSTQNSSINPTSNVYIGSRENDLDGMSSIVVCTGTDSTWQSGSEYRTHITPSGIQVSYGNKTQSSSVSVQSGDIINNSKWDGTNTSLKTALANKISKETNTTVSWTSSATGRTVTCMLAKIGTIVICTITGSTDANHSITAWTATQLGVGQIPAGYRPSSATEGRIPIQTGGATLTVNTVGTIAITTWSNLGGQMAFGGTLWWKTS